jgi:hypothetical protein
MMSLFSLWRDQPSATHPADIHWYRNAHGSFPHLLRLHPERLQLDGLGGVTVLWHAGLSPQWLYAGCSADLGKSLNRLRDNPLLLKYESHGGVYVTWSPVREEYRSGVTTFLRHRLKPLIAETLENEDGPDLTAKPIAVLPPL